LTDCVLYRALQFPVGRFPVDGSVCIIGDLSA